MGDTERLYLGVDVGTGSVRAGLFDGAGELTSMAAHDIRIWRPDVDFVEQSSDDIWSACCEAVHAAMGLAGAGPERVRGIGFDATCSLVVLDEMDSPVTVSPTGRDEQNVIVWMDHRAIPQARQVNKTKHEVLKYVGGTISPEMESPKLMWLKEHLPLSWRRAAHFFDLPDFLTYRATGDATRSLCSTVCKWTYQGHEPAGAEGSVGRWDESYWRAIDLPELVEEQYRRIGSRVRPMGEALGQGLTDRAARELGLEPRTPVSVSIIDAHAGGLGLLGAGLGTGEEQAPGAEALRGRLALIGGTSSCHMAVSSEPCFVPGVWGPYFSAMVPDLWLNEGGQSATGSLVDHVVFGHAASGEVEREAARSNKTAYDVLNERLEELAAGRSFRAQLTSELHVLPYHHGNRSPRADPTLRGIVAGLTLSQTVDDLALLYYATIQAIAYGTRHIIEALAEQGYRVEQIHMCGGGTKNPVFLQEHADITGCPVVLSGEPEAVLLGSAILGAVAAKDFPAIPAAMASLSRVGSRIEPAGEGVAAFHDAKYQVFQRMYRDQLAYRKLMSPVVVDPADPSGGLGEQEDTR